MKIKVIRNIFLLGAFIFAACAAMGAFAEVNYTRLRKRIVGRELIDNGAQVVYTYEQAGRTWSETNAVRHLTLPREIRYSKLKLITAAKSAGKWADVKAFIQRADMEDEWQACQFISSLHPAYIAATNAVISAGVATDEEVRLFMKAAED